jgi:hypothetical protein
MTQTLIVVVLVAWAGVYAAWVLMPAPLKRAVLRWGRRHCPGLVRRMAPAAESGCGGCGGNCGPAPVKRDAGSEVKVIQLHLKRR